MRIAHRPVAFHRVVVSGLLAIGCAFAAPAGAAMPALADLRPLPLHYGVNSLRDFAPDGRAATVFMAHRENGNAHGYDVLVVSVDAARSDHAAPESAELVEVERQGGESPDLIRIEPFDGENAISAVRLARDRLDGAPATLLLQARRQLSPGAALTDTAPVELRVWRLDGPSDEVGRTPYTFRLAGVATTTQRYRDASLALDHELARAAEPAPYASLPSAERVSADIAAFGALAVLRDRLWPDHRVFDSLLTQTATGDPDWLRIAAALRAVSDAAASEGLSAALSLALARQPENVLRLLPPAAGASTFTVAEVCSARFAFIEQPAAEERWRIEASRAVAAERDDRLASVRDACLAALPPAQ